MKMADDSRIFYVHGFGESGYAGLYAFVPFSGKKAINDLDVNETTEGRFQNPTSDKRPERVTRVK